MEALETKVPLMISPTVRGDSQYNCGIVSKKEYGICVQHMKVEEMEKGIEYIKKNNYFQRSLSLASAAAIHKKNDPQNSLYWIRYLLDNDTSHLIPEDTADMGYLQLCDADIHFAIAAALFAVILLVYNILKCVFCAVCCRKAN